MDGRMRLHPVERTHLHAIGSDFISSITESVGSVVTVACGVVVCQRAAHSAILRLAGGALDIPTAES